MKVMYFEVSGAFEEEFQNHKCCIESCAADYLNKAHQLQHLFLDEAPTQRATIRAIRL